MLPPLEILSDALPYLVAVFQHNLCHHIAILGDSWLWRGCTLGYISGGDYLEGMISIRSQILFYVDVRDGRGVVE